MNSLTPQTQKLWRREPGVIPQRVPLASSGGQSGSTVEPAPRSGESPRAGALIVNADDWGRDPDTTDRTYDCVFRGTVSSVSAMVFMDDSERAAALAREKGIDAGLHLNFTASFSSSNCPDRLREQQRRLGSFLLIHPLARLVFHPGLVRAFEYVVTAQFDEFRRLYGKEAQRLDGHHHMHLCTNVLLARLLPPGIVVRRNFSFRQGQKSAVNRLYRKAVDHMLARRHRIVDFLFNLSPLEPAPRLKWILSLARQSRVELETHPVNPEEYQFLTGGGMLRLTRDLPIASHFAMPA